MCETGPCGSCAGQETENLWRRVLAVGDITVQSRRDDRGDYVYVRCRTHTSLEIICTAASLSKALRAIVEWAARPYCVIETRVQSHGCWRPLAWTHYTNELAVEKAVQKMREEHPCIEYRWVRRDPVAGGGACCE